MFDINFIKNTFCLKEEIIEHKWSSEDCEELYSLFEQNRNIRPCLFSVETTNACNMTCEMCPRTTEMDRKIENMDKSIFKRISEQIFPHDRETYNSWIGFVENELGVHQEEISENHFYFFVSSRVITMHGFGEPVLDPYIQERVEIFSQKGIPTYFSCNPANIDLKKIESLFHSGLSYIKFSIDSLSDTKMKEIRGRNADFTAAYKKILQVLDVKEERNYSTDIVVCMIMLNIEQEKEAEDFLRLWEGKDVYAYIKSQDNQWYFQEQGSEKAKSHYEDQYCEFPWTSLSVMVDGTVVPCTQDFNCEMPMGHTNDSSLEEIWNSEMYRQFRMMHISGEFLPKYKCMERCDLKIVADFLS
jgi:radical SAM protein with 4Fe4S-binding SPASM domain